MQHDFILLDRSNSMASSGKWEEALSSINTYVTKLAEDNVDTGVTVATFDSINGKFMFDIVRDKVAPSAWVALSNKDADPRGWTPLNDAIGKIVALANSGREGAQYEKVAMIIVTDGEENCSRELTFDDAKARLDECRKKGWQVLFFGADFDNTKQSVELGASVGTFVMAAAGNMGMAMAESASMRAAYATTSSAMNYSEEQRRKFAKSRNN